MNIAHSLFERLTGKSADTEGARQEAGNFAKHLFSLAFSKVADSLINPKLILSWLLVQIGAGGLTGLLVPLREAGALLPQLFISPRIQNVKHRKWVWASGALGQGVCAAAMLLSVLLLDGHIAGAAIIFLLALLAICRSACSVAYKDVLGRTIETSRRGTVTGTAGSIAAAATLGFGLLLALSPIDKFILVLIGLGMAAVAWITAAALFTRLEETSEEETSQDIQGFFNQLHLLRTDKQLQWFILTRACLTVTALAPPFMVSLGPAQDVGLGVLGLLVLAAAGAELISGSIWGRLSDKSSRRVLILAGAASTAILLLTSLLGWAAPLTVVTLPALLFGLMVTYHAVRVARSTHLVDMGTDQTRTIYTALSNTIIGIVLLAGAGFTGIAAWIGPAGALGVMALFSAAGALAATQLEDVQRES